MKYVWKIIVREKPGEAGQRQGFAFAGSMAEALELSGTSGAIAIPQPERSWPYGDSIKFCWHEWQSVTA